MDDGVGGPETIRSVAVHVEDVVRALEARERGRAPCVLRVTPPFSGRMRARLHVEGGEAYDPGDREAPLHLSPGRFVADPPPFPAPDHTEDELRASDEEYTPERHREYHERRVEEWRVAVASRIRAETTVDTAAGEIEVEIVSLGEWAGS